MSRVESFPDYLARIGAARPEEYAEAARAGAACAGLDPAAAAAEFARIKAFILDYYRGVHPVRSVAGPDGEPVDYVPYDQQPAARSAIAAGHRLLESAPPPAALPGSAPIASAAPADLQPPSSTAPPGTVPMARLSFDRLLRRGTLEANFRKDQTPPAPSGE